MGSKSKKRTTTAKLNREHKLRERRRDKQARKDARKLSAADADREPRDDAQGDLPRASGE
jgi:hypothetical protein